MARPADVRKAYTVAVVFAIVGIIWGLVGRGADGRVPTVAVGLTVAGGLGIIAAAFTSIRQKRREAAGPSEG